jgi:hypothetical protein
MTEQSHLRAAQRGLLVPKNIREIRGSFFTPEIWVKKSHEYLARAFGENWQDEYTIWDCAAGTGNLLAGLANKYNIWASDIDQSNVDTMQSLIEIDENLNLLSDHVFQFDFLNDSFNKLPEDLQKIINDPEKRKKLIIYINPPYAEHSTKTVIVGHGIHKSKIATESKVYKTFEPLVGTATRELFVQFFLRVYQDIAGSKLASFSKLKHITAQNFMKFRGYFKAKFENGFICIANSFDNVKGEFPIGFLIWNLEDKQDISQIETDVLYNDNAVLTCWKQGTKTFFPMPKNGLVIDWLRNYYNNDENIGFLRMQGTDMQHNRSIFITNKLSDNDIKEHLFTHISKTNVIEMSIYLAIRNVIEASWLNDRDQFLFPNNHWESDTAFQYNCLVFILFHGQNRISSANSINHWIPFSEIEVDSKKKFASNFMNQFLKNKTFSPEAQAVLDAGLELWKYYHAQIKYHKTAPVNASFYDIREFFQGRKENGTMNTQSKDEIYNGLITTLREAQKALAKIIEPKVYEYGFLKE